MDRSRLIRICLGFTLLASASCADRATVNYDPAVQSTAATVQRSVITSSTSAVVTVSSTEVGRSTVRVLLPSSGVQAALPQPVRRNDIFDAGFELTFGSRDKYLWLRGYTGKPGGKFEILSTSETIRVGQRSVQIGTMSDRSFAAAEWQEGNESWIALEALGIDFELFLDVIRSLTPIDRTAWSNLALGAEPFGDGCFFVRSFDGLHRWL